jgi:hypothetical protein
MLIGARFRVEITQRDAAPLAVALANPPVPNAAARRAARRFRKDHG